MKEVFVLLGITWLAISSCSLASERTEQGAVRIPEGRFTPLYGTDLKSVALKSFLIDKYPVSVDKFRQFLKSKPEYSKTKLSPLFSDSKYLSGLGPKPTKNESQTPVVFVSWFAASAYCEWAGGRLPDLIEWEYVAAADSLKADASKDPIFNQKILAWYGRPATKKSALRIGATPPNFYGVHDLHGLIWEWTADFNSAFITADNRQDGEQVLGAVCGAGSTGASNRSDYAAFMRYAMRSSLEAKFSLPTLGFRCAYDK